MRTCVLLCLFFASLSPLHGRRSIAAEGAPKEPETQSSDAASTARDEKELIQFEKDFAAATLKGDHDFYDRVLADDWVNIHEDGSVGTKQADAAHKSEYDTVTFDDIKVRVYGDSAVAVGRYSVGWTEAGRHSAVSGRFTDVWLRRGGRWQIVSTQNTPFRQAKPDEFPSDSFFIAKEKEVWEALKHKDKATATRLLADDFVGMYDFGFFNKSEWVKQTDDVYSVDDYTISNPKVLHLSPTTALLLYTATCKGTGAWADYCSQTSRISDLWVERNGEWLDLFSQDTTAAGSEQEMSAQALAKEREILETLKHNDWPAFSDLLADDAVAIDEDGIVGKKELIDGIKVAGTIFSDYKMENVKVIPQANGAIVAYTRKHWSGRRTGSRSHGTSTLIPIGNGVETSG